MLQNLIFAKNSITRLSRDYENKLVNKIKETFTEQQIFLASFYYSKNFISSTLNIYSFFASNLLFP